LGVLILNAGKTKGTYTGANGLVFEFVKERPICKKMIFA
jgi:hypothetical protein